MSMRDFINKKPSIAVGVVVTLVIIISVIVLKLQGGLSRPAPTIPMRFFTVDDGKTYFADSLKKIPPFQTADGKTAFGARVVKCGTGAPFVLYLDKFNDVDKKRIEGWFADSKTAALAIESITGPTATPVAKRALTGDSGWVEPKDGAKYDAVVQQNCPDGGAYQNVAVPK